MNDHRIPVVGLIMALAVSLTLLGRAGLELLLRHLWDRTLNGR